MIPFCWQTAGKWAAQIGGLGLAMALINPEIPLIAAPIAAAAFGVPMGLLEGLWKRFYSNL